MGAVSVASGALGLAGGLYQTLSGARQERDASKALENYERQQLENVAKNLEVSTLGSDIQREEQARLASTQINALRGGGTRALLAGLGRVEAGNQDVNRKIAADIDMQQKQIQQQEAEDQARIRAMQENRENADIAALSSQVQAGRQDMWGGIGNAVKGFGMAGQALAGINTTPQVNGIDNEIEAQGVVPLYQPASRIQPSTLMPRPANSFNPSSIYFPETSYLNR